MKDWFTSEAAQGAFEYVLTVGVVVVLMAIGLMAFGEVVRLFVGNLCPSVDTGNPLVAIGSCITS